MQVGESDVDDAVLAGKGHSGAWLDRAVRGEKPFSCPACQQHAQLYLSRFLYLKCDSEERDSAYDNPVRRIPALMSVARTGKAEGNPRVYHVTVAESREGLHPPQRQGRDASGARLASGRNAGAGSGFGAGGTMSVRAGGRLLGRLKIQLCGHPPQAR